LSERSLRGQSHRVRLVDAHPPESHKAKTPHRTRKLPTSDPPPPTRHEHSSSSEEGGSFSSTSSGSRRVGTGARLRREGRWYGRSAHAAADPARPLLSSSPPPRSAPSSRQVRAPSGLRPCSTRSDISRPDLWGGRGDQASPPVGACGLRPPFILIQSRNYCCLQA
jgi:hypothetical protein